MTALNRFSDWLNQALVYSPRWLFNSALLVLATVGYAFLCHQVFHGVPRIDDSVAAVYQARLFAAGSLIWPIAADIQPWFDIFGIVTPMDKPDHWVGMYTPGWPLLLTPGVVLGVPWLVNPVLGGLLVIVIAEIATDTYGKLTGRVAGILALVSPYIGVVSASYLSHTAAALFAALAWWCTARLLHTQKKRWGIFAGCAIGFTLLIRPESAVLIGLVIAAGSLVQVKKALAVWKTLLAATGVALVFVGILLGWQAYTVGEAGAFGHRLDMGASADFGFGRVGDSGYHYTPNKAWMHSENRLNAIHEQMLGWPVPALILLLAPFLLVPLRWRHWRHMQPWRELCQHLWLILPLVALTSLFYYYWYYEEWLPGRYFFPAVPFLVVLMAKGWHVWQTTLSKFKLLRSLPALMLVGGSAFALAYSAPQYHQFFKAHHGDVEDWLERYVDHYKLDNALVLTRSLGRLQYGQWNDYYATAFMYNDLELNGNVVFARDNAHRRQATTPLDNTFLFEQYPNRNYYYYTFNQSNGRSIMYKLTVDNNTIVSKIRLRDPQFARINSAEKAAKKAKEKNAKQSG